MSNKTSLIITSTDTSGKTSNKTLTDINPATSSASLKSFAEGLIGLTDNTYDGAAIVERTEVVDDTEKVPAHAQFTINGRVYTEADAVLKDSFLQLDVTFNASDETYVKTNSDGRKEVQFRFDEIETFAVAYGSPNTATWTNNCPRVSFLVSPRGAAINGSCWGSAKTGSTILTARVEFFDEGSAKDNDALIIIGSTKSRRGWIVSVKLNREG